MFLLALVGIFLMSLVCMFASWATEKWDREHGYVCDSGDDLFDWRMKGIDL